jgi:cyclohexanone monooxygenase
MTNDSGAAAQRYDVLVVGAGFSGLYLINNLRQRGFSVVAVERGEEVGGTWFWNRYPGARCDIESFDYSYSWSPELLDEWDWSERYATQPEILAYLKHVADRYDLRKDIIFKRSVETTTWSEDERSWTSVLDNGDRIESSFVLMASGNLTTLNEPNFRGVESFKGRKLHTARWPHEGVGFSGRRVAVIGTGSSGVQCIPLIAMQAEQLFVLQRTPNYVLPAQNRPVTAEERDAVRAEYQDRRTRSKLSESGVPQPAPTAAAYDVDDEVRRARYEDGWQRGGVGALSFCFNDMFESEESNYSAQQFVRDKIRSIVKDPEIARKLSPSHHIGTKRSCVGTDYYETYNRPNVELVDVKTAPIVAIEENGVRTEDRLIEVDDIVFATGFDAITGALTQIDIKGVDGETLRDAWSEGPQTYLGLQSHGFPNLFMVTGPQSPVTLSNAMVSIEQHVEFISDCLEYLRDNNLDRIEASAEAQDEWVQHTYQAAEGTLYLKTTNTWHHGGNIPGKKRIFMPYIGGVGTYRGECEEVVSKGYLGFELAAAEAPGAYADPVSAW